MSGTRIDITGGDGAHYSAVIGMQSRVVEFPDGVARHITLSNWQWQVVDWLVDEAGWPPEALPGHTFDHAMTFWMMDLFNDLAQGSRCAGVRGEDHDHSSGFNAADEASRFERQLRESLVSMIRVAMPIVTGRDKPSNDQD